MGRKQQPDLNERLIGAMKQRHRAAELETDPSSIPGMTQAELNDVINTGSIPTALLHQVLNGGS